jgi:hypothetical protein
MKRRSFLLGAASSLFGERIANAAFAIFQTTLPISSFNPVTVASELHVFGMDPSDPTQYLVPGNGAPAVSTSAFYNSAGLYNFRCQNLDDMGAAGAAVKAANGGRPYVWVWSADHPVFSYSFRGGENTYVGFSFQPWDFPKKCYEILPKIGTYQTPNHTVSGGFQSYEFPTLGYNPDDPDGLPFYIWIETGPDHWTMLWRSADLVTFALKEISHWHTPSLGLWSAFVRYYKRNGTNDFTTIAQSGVQPVLALWNSTDGIEYTDSGVAIVGFDSGNQVLGSQYALGYVFQVGSQRYCLAREDAAGGGLNQYATIVAMDNANFNVLSSPAKIRIASGWGNANFPGPTYLQEVTGYLEDGILYAWPTYGFPNDVNTTAGSSGRGGAPYSLGGGLDHQFIDKIALRVDDAAARLGAPVGMGVSAAAGTATITWKDALPQNTVRLYRGTNATTQATLIGDYTGVTSATDSPSEGRYWYKLVTLDSGTERKSRVLSVYVSSSSAFVNEHIDRVLDDGADSSTINRAFLDRMDSMLTSVGIRNVLELLTHPAAGVKTSTSPIKIYDPGTTRLPRSEDFKPTTAATTYSATSVNGGPCWINANTNSYGYWGNPKRGNTIQQKRQITIIVAYERTQTTDDFTFVGTGPIWGNSIDGNKILALKHTAGSPGNIEFSLSDETSTKTASVAASGSGMQIAIGTYDGTDMLAYTGSTAGSAVSTLDPNPNFGKSTAGGTPGFVLGSLAGGRNSQSNGSSGDSMASPFPQIFPLLGSGSVHNYVLRRSIPSGVADVMTFTETSAKGKIQCVMVLEEAVSPSQITDIISFLTSTADW